ncbi:hypothetical protein BDZ97DRAFT_1878187 [Flammula alnicola]|nr:hypothetical protein BDZ97DRAFT_1878187 [Flammula alnicola]
MAAVVPFRKKLPPEVWTQIIGDVPHPQLSNLLNVCSQFHDIVIRTLFSSIKVYFIGGEQGKSMLNTFHMDWVEETARKLMGKSWEILNHIRQEPSFARVVKSITVVAFSDGLSIFERLTVANALLFVPNLQTFRWIGNGPAFDDIVAECLPSILTKLVVQSSFPLNSLQHLTKITSLYLPMPFFFPDDEEAHDELAVDIDTANILTEVPVENILNALTSELLDLRLCAMHIISIPIRVCSTLTELEILVTIGDPEEFIGLDVVLRHATSLESLTVVGFVVPTFFSFLPHSSTSSLPKLTSFRLSCEYFSWGVGEDELCALCGFLQGRPSLRRLYLRLTAMRMDQTSRLLCIIRGLEGLEVLGLHTGRDILSDPEIITMLAQSLSVKLRALYLAVNWGGETLLVLLDAIAKLPHLSFLHLYGTLSRLPILLEDLAGEAKGLQMIGLNRALWDIERVGSNIITNKWPRWKIKFCVEEDFLCADDAWLFKYN